MLRNRLSIYVFRALLLSGVLIAAWALNTRDYHNHDAGESLFKRNIGWPMHYINKGVSNDPYHRYLLVLSSPSVFDVDSDVYQIDITHLILNAMYFMLLVIYAFCITVRRIYSLTDLLIAVAIFASLAYSANDYTRGISCSILLYAWLISLPLIGSLCAKNSGACFGSKMHDDN